MLVGHARRNIRSVAWSQPGLIASASVHGAIIIWDGKTGEPQRVFVPLANDESVTLSAEGKLLYGAPAVAEEQLVYVIEDESGKLDLFKPSEFRRRFPTAPAAQLPVRRAEPEPPPVLNPKPPPEPNPSQKHAGPVFSVDISPDDATVVTGGEVKVAYLWDTSTKAIRATLPHESAVTRIESSPDGSKVFTYETRTAHVWDAKSGTHIGKSTWGGYCARIPDDGRFLLIFGPGGGNIREKYEFRTSNLATGEVRSGRLLTRTNLSSNSASFGADGRVLATLDGGNGRTVHLWDVATGKRFGKAAVHPESVLVAQMLVSRGGKTLLTVCNDKTVRVWDPATARMRCDPLQHDASVGGLRFSPDETIIVSWTLPRMVYFWNSSTGQAIGEPFELPLDALTSPGVAPSRDKRKLVAASRQGRYLIMTLSDDLETGSIDALADPGSLTGYRRKVGQSIYFRVTGAVAGTVWGTGVYTDDSPLATAAVHAGVLQNGQSGIVKVTILKGQASYTGSTRNGVATSSYSSFSGSYRCRGGRTHPCDSRRMTLASGNFHLLTPSKVKS